VYKQLGQNKSAKSDRLACHKAKKVVVFERVYKKDKLGALKQALKAGNVRIDPRAQKSEYMESQLFTHINKEKIVSMVQKRLQQESTANDSDKNAVIDLLIYENDKKDPKKKTEKAKLYAGYLGFDFKLDNTLVYKIQIDFLDMQGRDIQQRIDCAVQSVMSL